MNITRVPCMAIIVNTSNDQANGRLVEVLHCVAVSQSGPWWRIVYVGGQGPAFDPEVGDYAPVREADIIDDCLRPVPGNEETLTEQTEQELTA